MQVHTCIMYMHASYYSMLYSNINTLKISDMTAWKIIKLFQIQYKRKPYFSEIIGSLYSSRFNMKPL